MSPGGGPPPGPEVIEDAWRYAEEHLSKASPGSASEYLAVLLGRAAQAVARGNYGIAAALVARMGGQEVVCLGSNTMRSALDPTGHAEINAIRAYRGVASAWGSAELPEWPSASEVASSQRTAYMRGPAGEGGPVLYATLEPCPMCTVALINLGVTRVVVANPDPEAGALLAERLAALPPVWPKLARARPIEVVQAAPWAGGDLGIPERLYELIQGVFLFSRQGVDDWLEGGGLASGLEAGEGGVLPGQA